MFDINNAPIRWHWASRKREDGTTESYKQFYHSLTKADIEAILADYFGMPESKVRVCPYIEDTDDPYDYIKTAGVDAVLLIDE